VFAPPPVHDFATMVAEIPARDSQHAGDAASLTRSFVGRRRKNVVPRATVVKPSAARPA